MNLAESSPAESHEAIYSRIRTIGQVGRILCSFVFWLLLIASVLGAIASALCVIQADIVAFSAGPVSISETTGSLSKAAVLTADLMSFVVPALFVALAAWLMRKLFANFVAGEVLSSVNGRLIRWIGMWFLVAAVAGVDPFSVIFGLFLLVLGWAMELAASAKQDQELTV